jgi:hypothetical protein
MRRNVSRHDRASAHQAPPAQAYSAEDRCVRPHGDTFFQPGHFGSPVGISAAREPVVGQDDVRAEEDIIRNVHVAPDRHSILHGHIVGERDMRLNERMVSDVTVPAYRDIRHDVSERPDARARADSIGLD